MTVADIPILHLDDDLVVVAKPAGLMVHRDEWSQRETVVLQTVSHQIGRYLLPVHRLDRNTSGVLAFALTKDAARTMQASLQANDWTKEYLVLCRRETPESFVCDRELTVNGTKRPARTDFRRLATFSRCSLLAARLYTGRTHQIRRHLAHMAHQVIGDSSYGKGQINAWFRENHGLPRMFIHARRLVLPHPRTGAALEVVEPLADDLRGFLGRLPDVDPAVIVDL